MTTTTEPPVARTQPTLITPPAHSQAEFLMPDTCADRYNPETDGLQSADAFPWEEDNGRMKSTTQMPEKLKVLFGGDYPLADQRQLEMSDAIAQEACSENAHKIASKGGNDIDRANNKCLHRLKITRNRLVPIVRELSRFYPQCSLMLSGFFLYPKGGGYMGWHTNSGAACTRVYITHAPESDKSFFRYHSGGKYVTSWDKEGWNIRQFEVSESNKDPLWHCVYSDTKRLSIGFRINKNLNPLK